MSILPSNEGISKIMIVVSLISFKLRLITQIVTEVGKLLPSKFHTKSLEVMLIVVPVKEALELEANRMVEDISSLLSSNRLINHAAD
jgi:hypothetical protein